MMSRRRRGRPTSGSSGRSLLAAGTLGLLLWSATAGAVDPSPFEPLMGRWVGEGRLGVKDNATERVECRVTYARGASGDQLRQSIRCSSAGGNVEVRSLVSHAGGKVNGTWKELVRNMSGNVSGAVTPRGFRVSVRGDSLNANMDIILVDARQVIEIQFIDSSLVGLTLILQKG
jgi:hypothetical protein